MTTIVLRTVTGAQHEILLDTPVHRKAPSERLQRAAAEASGVELAEEEDAALRFALRPGAAAWEAGLARFLQEKCRAPELLLVWLFQIGPARLLVAAAVLAGARLVYNLDPGFSAVYLLLAMIAAIYINLGTKQEGEASAYSVSIRACGGCQGSWMRMRSTADTAGADVVVSFVQTVVVSV
ncbi:hypothetical protein COO60DRAFT_1627983 [Scenedesmus sp. NREL 46B-D3]|nr:hypothetical protein COO60DRAFT_1627983 [Scenedesmus sp. NREL 46B-D3]